MLQKAQLLADTVRGTTNLENTEFALLINTSYLNNICQNLLKCQEIVCLVTILLRAGVLGSQILVL